MARCVAMITCKDFWNQRAQVYDAQVEGFYRDAYEKTTQYSLKHLRSQDRVLEFACGTGIVTCSIAPHVAHIRAIDIADEMVRQAREKVCRMNLSNVDVTQTDLFDPSLEPGSFDAVMAFNVLLYVDALPQVLHRIHTLLKPGGIFLSATDCLGEHLTIAGLKKFWKSHTGSMPYVGFYSMKTLECKIAQNGFSILHSENLFPSPPNLFLAAQKNEVK